MIIEKGKSVSFEYTLTLEDKEVIDTNVGAAPMTFTHGSDQIIPGHEDEMVGHSIILKTNSWILDGLFVKKEFRSNGIAKKLTESRINYAKEMGASEIHFCCADENLASIKSHEKSGFKEYRKATKSESPVPGCWYIKNFKV